MERITYSGAAFLSVIAIVPSLVSTWMKIPYGVSTFLGGTGLLIVVSVILDFVQRVEANLLMRNYPGFLSDSKVSRIKGAH
jgi:preprotein translocase subunit SecY